ADAAEADGIMQAFAHGMLLRNGETAPLVRAAVHQTMSTQRFIEVCSRFPEDLDDLDEVPMVRDARIADALTAHADAMLTTLPQRAAELYTAAAERGADVGALVIRRLQAAWSSGALEHASMRADTAIATRGVDLQHTVGDVSAALWSARAMMNQADTVYRLAPPRGGSAVSAAIARFGV